jgi:hypothetical protein
MNKFKFLVHEGTKGLHIVVTRLSDRAQKYFFQTNKNKAGMESFLSSMTDELTESYFPKPDKHGRSPVDNWAYLGTDPDRYVLEMCAKYSLEFNEMKFIMDRVNKSCEDAHIECSRIADAVRTRLEVKFISIRALMPGSEEAAKREARQLWWKYCEGAAVIPTFRAFCGDEKTYAILV